MLSPLALLPLASLLLSSSSLNLSNSAGISGKESEPPKGFKLIPNAVTEETWKILQRWLETGYNLEDQHEPIPWQIGAQNRKVAQFGFRYDYEKDTVDTTTPTAPIPLRLKELLFPQNVSEEGREMSNNFTQCIINQYEADILIPWHKDDVDFGPMISVFTFGEARPLLLRRQHPSEDDTSTVVLNSYTAVPPHCSNYILSENARYEWEHMVPIGSDYRVSFTFRTHKTESE